MRTGTTWDWMLALDEALDLLKEHQAAHGTAEDHKDDSVGTSDSEIYEAALAQRWRHRRDEFLTAYRGTT